MARHNQHRTDNHPAGARRGLRTGAAALSLAAIAALGLSACGTQNTSNTTTATATAMASNTANAAVNAGSGKVTVKASPTASPTASAGSTQSAGTVTVTGADGTGVTAGADGSITVNGADGTGVTADASGNATVNGGSANSGSSAKVDEKAGESASSRVIAVTLAPPATPLPPAVPSARLTVTPSLRLRAMAVGATTHPTATLLR